MVLLAGEKSDVGERNTREFVMQDMSYLPKLDFKCVHGPCEYVVCDILKNYGIMSIFGSIIPQNFVLKNMCM